MTESIQNYNFVRGSMCVCVCVWNLVPDIERAT
jgi:hypothetical protein